MNIYDKLLKYSLLVAVFYFVAMSVAHFMSIKVPVLFIYYDTPFYSYQDKIISFCAFVYAIFFFAAFRHRNLVIYAIFALFITVLGLSAVNVSDDLAQVLKGQGTMAYWLQTGFIAVLVIWLFVLHKLSGKVSES